ATRDGRRGGCARLCCQGLLTRHLPLRRLWSDAGVLQPTDDVDDAIDQLRADYDTTPYSSVSFPPSAPGQLAAVAHLFGLATPEVSTARVLEIGCATGGNVIPFAAAHPQARAVGLELSQVQGDWSRAKVQALGLDN